MKHLFQVELVVDFNDIESAHNYVLVIAETVQEVLDKLSGQIKKTYFIKSIKIDRENIII